MRVAVLVPAVLCAFGLAAHARAGDPPVHEEIMRVPVLFGSEKLELETTVYSDGRAVRHPLALFLHGVPRDSSGMKAPRWRPAEAARFFVDRGFTVVVPMRRGYAASEGVFSEAMGPCVRPDFETAGRATAADARAVIEAFRPRGDINVDKTIVVGHSGGGLGALAFASLQPKEVVGVVNFSGGRGSVVAGAVCAPERLMAAMKTFGSTTKVPSLWVYAENDQAFSPWIAHAMFDAFGASSHPKFVALTPVGSDGHFTADDTRAIAQWKAPVTTFVQALGL